MAKKSKSKKSSLALDVNKVLANVNTSSYKDLKVALKLVSNELEFVRDDQQKDFRPVFRPFARARKRIETTFSQLCDQFMMTRNYTKDFAVF